jgi:putative toxin-antitoxin system antitoxin component (TIGR02293 family)
MTQPKLATAPQSRNLARTATATPRPKPAVAKAPAAVERPADRKTKGMHKLLASHDFVGLYAASPMDQVAVVKGGIAATEVARLADALKTPRESLYRWLGLPRQTVARKAKEAKDLSPQEGERLLGMAKLVGQVQTMVRESGDPTGFDAAAWMAQWLEQPLTALGGRAPAELMDTSAGQGIVSQLLARSQSGAYA